MMKPLVFLVLAAAGSLMIAAPAWADCGADASTVEVKDCLAQDLRDSDKRINAIYKLLMAGTDDPGKLGLRDQQRAWLKGRDKACSLDNKEADREKWLQAIMADQNKTTCVVRYTFERVAQLDAMLKQRAPLQTPEVPAAPQPLQLKPAPQAVAVSPTDEFSFLDDGYVVESKSRHERGKWYLEMRIDRAGIAQLGDALLAPSISNGPGGIGRLLNIRRTHTAASPVAIGIAVDLDNGFIYWRERGTWLGKPDTVSGSQLKLGRSYWTQIEGSAEVRELMHRGLIKVNLGRQPFEYVMPDGYRPFAEQ